MIGPTRKLMGFPGPTSTQLFSGSNYFSIFFCVCPTKMVQAQKRVPFFSRVTEQLSPNRAENPKRVLFEDFHLRKGFFVMFPCWFQLESISLLEVPWMDGIHFAPPKKPWNDASPVNTKKHCVPWFHRISSIHSVCSFYARSSFFFFFRLGSRAPRA